MSDCCKTLGEPTKPGDRLLCHQCGHEGRPVDRTTIDALLKPESLSQVNGNQYVFCETPSCPVVYYAADGTEFGKNQVRVRVGLKETEDPVPVCYCFGVTERMIIEEVQRTGRSSASARIRAEVKAGTCRCEVENPSGQCCLGDVIRVEKHAAAQRNGSEHAVIHREGERSRMRPSDKTLDRIRVNESLATDGATPPSNTSPSQAGPANTATTASTAGGLLAAFLASICCIGPVVFAALGVGVGATGFLADTAGVLKALLPYRPLFIGLTAMCLAVAFYVAYRKPRAVGIACQACVSTSGFRPNRWLLWIIAGLAVALVLAPYWLEFVTGS